MGTGSKVVTHLSDGLPTTETVDANIFGQGTVAERPASGDAVGDIYIVVDDPIYRFDIWNGSSWITMGGGGTDSNAIHKTTSAEISGLTEKTTPVSADVFVIEDSAASYAKKKLQVGNLPTGSGGVETKAGSVAWTSFTSGNPDFYDVTFGTAFSTASYVVTWGDYSTTTTIYSSASRTVNGFRIYKQSKSTNGTCHWVATKIGS